MRRARILFVAMGGGGDALGALMVARTFGVRPAAIATFAWERKMFDPHPGPRAPADFTKLRRIGRHNWRVSRTSALRAGVSHLPRVAAFADAPVFLLDASGGGLGLAAQLKELAALTRSDGTMLVDVGGDVLARGDEPGLRSPLADGLVLAAAARLARPVVACLGAGLDGEIRQDECEVTCASARRAGWSWRTPLPGCVAAETLHELRSHPSEVTTLACLSALGLTGTVEMRSAGSHVKLGPQAADIHLFETSRLLARSRVARAVADTPSLSEAADAARQASGADELETEQRAIQALVERGRQAQSSPSSVESVQSHTDRAHRRGANFLTLRRVAELLGISNARDFIRMRHSLARMAPVSSRLHVLPCDPDSLASGLRIRVERGDLDRFAHIAPPARFL